MNRARILISLILSALAIGAGAAPLGLFPSPSDPSSSAISEIDVLQQVPASSVVLLMAPTTVGGSLQPPLVAKHIPDELNAFDYQTLGRDGAKNKYRHEMLEWYAKNGEASFTSALRSLRDEITFNELAASNLQSRIIKFEGLFHAFKEDETNPAIKAQITKFHDHLDHATTNLQRLVRENAEVEKLKKTDPAAAERLEDIYFLNNQLRDKESTPLVQAMKEMRETGFQSTQVVAFKKALNMRKVLANNYRKQFSPGNQPELQAILSRYLSWLVELDAQVEVERDQSLGIIPHGVLHVPDELNAFDYQNLGCDEMKGQYRHEMLEWYAENGEASFISALRTLRDEITFNELAASNLQSRIIKFQGLFHAFKEDETDPTTIAQITKFHDHLDRFTSRLQRLVREEAEVKKLRKTDQAAGDRLEDIYFMANEMRDKDSTPFVQTLKKMRETGFRSTQVAAYRKALDSMMVLAKKYQKELEAGNQPQLQVILSRYLSWLREMEVQFEEEMSSRHEDEEEEEEEVDFTVEVIG